MTSSETVGVTVLLAGEEAYLDRVGDAVTRERADAEVEAVGTVEAARDRLGRGDVDALVCTDAVGERRGVELLERAGTRRPGLTTVLLTDQNLDGAALETLAAGVDEYFPRFERPDRLDRLADRVYETARPDDESDYRELFEKASDGVFLHDPETGVVVDANPRACEMTGYSREELVGETVAQFTADESPYTAEAARERIVQAATEESQSFEWKNVRKNGETFWSEISLKRTTIGGEERILAIAREVTERKRKERQLERSERQFRQIAEAVDEVIYLASTDLSETYYLSPAYEDIWGEPVAEMYEDPGAFLSAVHPEDREPLRDWLDEVQAELTDPEVDERDGYEYDYRVARDDDVRWIEGRLYPIRDDDGTVSRIASVNRDVTDQRRREQTLESVHEATERLTGAETPAEASAIAVDAAATVLEFPYVAVYQYDEAAGRLDAAATTDPLEGRVDAVEAGDHAWQVFVEGDAFRTAADSMERVLGVADLSELQIPLGRHGLLVVGTTADRGFDTDDVEAAQILAARLEAGLNHVEGEREIAARERRLEAETSRADRLATLNNVIRDIEQATIDESTREGVESNVCERLTDVDSYALAWVGERAVGSESLTVRNRSSATDTRTTPVDVVIDDPTIETHPAWRTLRTGESQVVEDLVVDRSQGAWRKQALTQGFHSCCTVPLSYDGVVHGVLTVYADEANAFDERERRVLEELGRSIGYAITTIERKRALESDAAVELDFDVGDDDLYVVSLAERTGGVVEHERAVRNADGDVTLFCTVSEVDEEAVAAVDGAGSERTVRVVSERRESWLLELSAADWFGSLFAEFGGVVEGARATPDGGTVTVELSRETSVRTVVDRFQREYEDSDLRAKRETEGRTRTLSEVRELVRRQLTDRQREVLETAYAGGYFEWPREASGVDVAEMLDITQPTFNRHLRMAEKRTFEMLLENG